VDAGVGAARDAATPNQVTAMPIITTHPMTSYLKSLSACFFFCLAETCKQKAGRQ
jgi:hypothetical protein